MERTRLIDYLPPIMQDFAEMQEIMRVENKETDQIDLDIRRVLDNGFIADCDEWGIQKFEHILKIASDSSDALELRKSRVMIHWNDSVPYTYRTLVKRLNAICGVNNYTISGDLEDYALKITTKMDIPGQTKEVEEALGKILPENIAYSLNNKLLREIHGSVMLTGAVVRKSVISISSNQ
ncbi:MAG: DUF2313 domain-containing protein [Lachnospiraceae bacterium]|nr:DUF2313 domain-containing protein [Lachnospiraceae bacterium]